MKISTIVFWAVAAAVIWLVFFYESSPSEAIAATTAPEPPDMDDIYWVSCDSGVSESWWYVRQDNLSVGIQAATELCSFASIASVKAQVSYGIGMRGVAKP